MFSIAIFFKGLFAVLLAYGVGSIPWGFLIGKFNGMDIRRYGSRNIGATNVRRVLGRDWGIMCFVLDFLKGLLPVLFACWLDGGDSTSHGYIPILAAAATVAGHIWPFTLKFKGGKGVATTIGALLALAPWPILITLLTWCAVFYLSRYVSLASLSAALMLPCSAVVIRLFRGTLPSWPTIVLLAALAALIIVRHRSNLIRLWQKTEYRFQPKKKTQSK